MLYTKSCPRCTGDVHVNEDSYGVYAKCLQCGFSKDFNSKREQLLADAEISEVVAFPTGPFGADDVDEFADEEAA